MFSQIERALTEVGFLSSSNPEPIMQTLHEILGRAELDSREVRILRGMMRQISWYVRKGYRLGPNQVQKP
jgi:tRNA/rRNA methyltransferase